MRGLGRNGCGQKAETGENPNVVSHMRFPLGAQ